ncbi:NUDIX hydrolase [Pseudoxanthomonas helianthi]|uniref:NUDIX hydrolase n=1 Tax=Pseudoxanthomonas helianthi TaxID=1453541 RepID=A0A941AUQ5_9GAMM|nr:NUDIX hydrolase [Pseudoxanthomonas helianthi]MBP3985125.1 NUDIX hydrolase [Pseudoxanthomonas helianthi]
MDAEIAVQQPSLAEQLADYRRRWPAEHEVADQFLALLADPANPFVRERLEGHFTGSAWLVSGDSRRVLLTHHRKLDRWLQLGGHADGDTDLAQVALKEAGEESGLDDLRVEAEGIFDLDRHWIPERCDVPGHWHYDVRYVVRAGDNEDYVVGEESLDLAWREIAPLADETDESLGRMARKWLALPFSHRDRSRPKRLRVARSAG